MGRLLGPEAKQAGRRQAWRPDLLVSVACSTQHKAGEKAAAEHQKRQKCACPTADLQRSVTKFWSRGKLAQDEQKILEKLFFANEEEMKGTSFENAIDKN